MSRMYYIMLIYNVCVRFVDVLVKINHVVLKIAFRFILLYDKRLRLYSYIRPCSCEPIELAILHKDDTDDIYMILNVYYT